MSQNLNGHVGEGDGSSSISSSSYESSFDPGEDEYKDINEDHKEESPQDVSGLLTHLNEMETKIIAQKAAEGNMNSEDTQQVLRQLSQLKVDLLTPSQHKASIGKTSRSRSSSRGRSLSSTGGSQHSSRSSSPGGRIGGPETGIVIMDPTHAPTLDDDTRSTRSRSAGRRVPRRGRKNAILEDDALQNSSHSIYSRGRALPRSSSDRSLRLDELAESTPAENQQGKLHQSWSGPAELHRSWSGSVGSLGRPRLGRPAKNKRFEPISTGSLHKPSVGRSDDIGPEPTFPMLGASVNIRYNDDESIGVGSQVYSRHGMARGSGHSVLSSDTKSTISAVREDRRLQAFEDKLAENDGYFPDLDKQPRSGPIRKSSAIWNIISNLVTFPIADPCICKEGHGAKKAWREKFTIFLIFLIASGAFVATVTVLPLYVCVESEEYYDQEQVARRGWTTIHGKVYNMKDYADIHPGGRTSMERYYGEDASKLFPRIPPAELPNYCLSNLLNETVFNETNSLGIQNVTCGYQSPEDQLRFSSPEGACHLNIVGGDDINEKFEEYYEGEWVIPGWDLGRKIKMEYIVIDDLVYNITGYIENLMQDGGLTLNINHKTNEFAYLAEALHVLVVNQRNGDATNIFYDLFRSPEDQEAVKFCLDELFYHSKIDTRYDETCRRVTIAQYSVAGFVVLLALIQILCSLVYVGRRPPQVRDDDKTAAIMVMVPCYNESAAELRKTIDSILGNDYPDENKCLVVVADGVMTGKGEALSTPETLGSILGFDFNPYHHGYEYESVGSKTKNEASIYSGNYQSVKHPRKTLKYIVVVKQGVAEERGTARAGNRGKRDSQLLLFGILNRMMYNRRPTELDLVFADALMKLNLSLNVMEFLMAIDADTRVAPDAMKYFIHKMDNDKSVLACCGETQVDNRNQSLITMIQVFEYYSAHHMKKAFESVFGCVTCLPGCFTMYRLYTEDQEPLLCCDNVYKEYCRNDIHSLHERNLYELGEDRMLTTLMLDEFHLMQLSFVPEAVCWTIVPHTLTVLLSQRRRWINSTIHNMLELMKIKTMCGISFFSMKTIIIFDLLSTFLLPSGCVYLYYIIVDTFVSDDPLTPLQIIAFVYLGMMTLPFIMRAEWSYMWHYISFLIAGVPVFYFYLPIYAFWHMDDLSWGKTRRVREEPSKTEIPSGEANENETDHDHEGSSSKKSRGDASDAIETIETGAGSGFSSGSGGDDDESPEVVALNATVVGAPQVAGPQAAASTPAPKEAEAVPESESSSCLACLNDRESGPDFEPGKLEEPLLPKLRSTCTCGRQQNEQNPPKDIRALDVILRPWQVDFVKSLGMGIATAQDFRVHFHENKFLPNFLKAWREQKGLPSTDVDTYRIALLVWDRTCKAILDSYDQQIRDGVNVPELPNFQKSSAGGDGKSIHSRSTATSADDDDGAKSFASESSHSSSGSKNQEDAADDQESWIPGADA